MRREDPTSALVSVCRAVGAKPPFWTQGAGGNVSLKVGPELWIKASGKRLDAVSEKSGWVALPLTSLRSALQDVNRLDESLVEKAYAETLRAQSGASLERPSMETGFHAFLPKAWVLHFHSLAAILFCELRRERPKELERWLAGSGNTPCAFIPPLLPGWRLCGAIAEKESAGILFLSNHGVILQCDGPLSAVLECLAWWSEWELRFCDAWGFPLLASLYRSPKDFAGSIALSATLPPTPLLPYFPDVAVFKERVASIAREEEQGKFRVDPYRWESDRDAAEILLAVQILHACRPTLSALPGKVAEVVAQLPTELHRRQKGKRQL